MPLNPRPVEKKSIKAQHANAPCIQKQLRTHMTYAWLFSLTPCYQTGTYFFPPVRVQYPEIAKHMLVGYPRRWLTCDKTQAPFPLTNICQLKQVMPYAGEVLAWDRGQGHCSWGPFHRRNLILC